ncbi:Solute-binding protein [Pleomorphomonas sp. T1.2MG-36]|uniref:TRAP transporter substrate-binding protein n=2 Tax=Pleomorphomonas sp. T1.2MG-36 TaxID=3041167 RepID=UPI00247755BE|nr:TRAP transporter substrate-binding protein [Pleomorphomonas sp. T1.2MG-36]CAI9400343.1 Solute-binding protein [Pleomorphomonas sp. T1.2MG-36]
MKRGVTCILGVVGAFGLASTAMADTVTFRAADIHPDGYPTVEAVIYMGKLVEERTGGRIKIQEFNNGVLGSEKDTIEQTQFGVIDFNRVSTAQFNNVVPETSVLGLPFVFKSVDHMHHVVDGPIGDEILKAFEAKGLIALAYYDSGARSIYTKKPIASLDDLKGLKLRVQQSDMWVATAEAMGTNPTPMPFGEVYSGLQTGVIDGAENNWPSYESSRHFEVAKHYTLTEHSLQPEVLVMAKSSYDKLSAEDQAIIRQAAKDSVPKMRELWAAREKASEAKVREAGSIIAKIDKGPFIEAMKPVYDKFITDPKLKDLVARIQATE